MNKPFNFRFYATLLDSFSNYLNSDVVYHKYYGFNENPKYTEEEFQQKQFDDLINRINREPMKQEDSEKADRGTAFNEIVDCLIENRNSDRMVLFSDKNQGIIQATYNGRNFIFPISFCREFADYFKGALTQQLTQAILPTCFGDVLLYGYIDELLPLSTHDIKTTSGYSVGKYKSGWQHIVYPYCLMNNGSDVRLFEYNILEFNKAGYAVDTYTETYVFEPERDIPTLTNHCEEFIRFLNDNRHLITDKKIFGGVNDV